MKKINQWRLIIGIILSIITVITVVIAFYNPFLFAIIGFIWAPAALLFEVLFKPYLEKLGNDEKKKEQKEERYKPIKEITKLLEGYENIKDEELMEIETTQRLGELFPKLQLIGFGLTQNSLRDNNFGVHVTNFPVIHQFLIRRLVVGKNKNPDEVYLSQRYPQTTKYSLNTNVQVLNDFIKYLKEKLGIKSN